VIALAPDELDFSEAYIEGDATARWRSASGHGRSDGAQTTGTSVLEVEPGRRLPEHTDSAEEVIVVVQGTAEVRIDGEEPTELPAGGLAVVPQDALHEVRNAGGGTLRFAAVYAAAEVVTTYREPVQPDGERERQSAS
jgi:quercetin dioxygenase-like cupin family protein